MVDVASTAVVRIVDEPIAPREDVPNVPFAAELRISSCFAFHVTAEVIRLSANVPIHVGVKVMV